MATPIDYELAQRLQHLVWVVRNLGTRDIREAAADAQATLDRWGRDERPELQAQCGEAFDCGMAAAAPQAYMVAADKALAADRGVMRRDERNKLVAELAGWLEQCFIGEVFTSGVSYRDAAVRKRWSTRDLAEFLRSWAEDCDHDRYVPLHTRNLRARTMMETLPKQSSRAAIEAHAEVDSGVMYGVDPAFADEHHVVEARYENGQLTALADSRPLRDIERQWRAAVEALCERIGRHRCNSIEHADQVARVFDVDRRPLGWVRWFLDGGALRFEEHVGPERPPPNGVTMTGVDEVGPASTTEELRALGLLCNRAGCDRARGVGEEYCPTHRSNWVDRTA